MDIIPSLALKCLVQDDIKCDHQKLSDEAKKYFYFFDSSTIVSITDYGVYVSFDGCQTFAHWNIVLLINEVEINESTDFKKCQENIMKEKKQGIQDANNINCFYLNFVENKKIVFSNVHARDKGSISFSVTSMAFQSGVATRVESLDFGKTWQAKTVKKDF